MVQYHRPIFDLKANVADYEECKLNKDFWVVILLKVYNVEGRQDDTDEDYAVHDNANPILDATRVGEPLIVQVLLAQWGAINLHTLVVYHHD